MKPNIHPKYYDNAKIKCACGAEFSVGSTEEEIHIEICSMCHPFFTGKEKLIDTAGRVDKFRARMKAAEKFKKTKELKDESPDDSEISGSRSKHRETKVPTTQIGVGIPTEASENQEAKELEQAKPDKKAKDKAK